MKIKATDCMYFVFFFYFEIKVSNQSYIFDSLFDLTDKSEITVLELKKNKNSTK